jgi:dTDP-4-amino-4,6-dideoxygalactose transaminase
MKVDFVNLTAQYVNIKNKIDSAIQNVINDTSFVGGVYVKDFEEEYANAYGVKYCISCANGTDAIYIALKALDIGLGDEVITVANSWISTSETITQTGAKPVFVDINSDYYTIDVNKIEEKITSKTKAIIPVHLFGQPCDMDTLTAICNKHNLLLIEDCAQAHFAEWKGKKVGTMGVAGTFSFFPGKNLGAYGDAGSIISNDSEFAKKARMFANHGALIKHKHEIEGINSRLDGMQAAILSVKLKYIMEWNEKRLKNSLLYNDYLSNMETIITPIIHPDVKHVFHLYVIRTGFRDELIEFLKDNGVSTGIHYPTALPFLKAYRYLGHKPDDFPVAHSYMGEILSLPMYPELTKEQIKYIIKIIYQFFDSAA